MRQVAEMGRQGASMLTIYAPEGIVRAEADRAGVIIQTDRRKMAPGTP